MQGPGSQAETVLQIGHSDQLIVLLCKIPQRPLREQGAEPATGVSVRGKWGRRTGGPK